MLASGFDNDKEALTIRAPPAYEPCKAGEAVEYAPGDGRCSYLVPASGEVEVNGLWVNARDGAAIKMSLSSGSRQSRIQRS